MFTTTYGPYTLETYEYSDNLTDPEVLRRRGYITRDGKPVCYGLKKFFNWQEPQAANIDWSTATVLEKMDGTCIRFWNDGVWHCSTLGVVDAANAPAFSVEGKSYADLTSEALGMKWQKFAEMLPLGFTYVFELVHPQDAHVVDYKGNKALYFLCKRDMETELESDELDGEAANYVRFPKKYDFNSLEQMTAFFATLDEVIEGFVVHDKDFNRVKVKTEEYFALAHANPYGVITPLRFVKMMQAGIVDDFYAVATDEQTKTLHAYTDAFKRAIEYLDEACKNLHIELDGRAFYESCKGDDAILFGYKMTKYNHDNVTAYNFILKQARHKICNFILEFM